MKKTLACLTVSIFMLMASAFAQQTTAGSFYTAPDGVKIHYEVKGEGFAVVLIHGFTGNGEGWKSGPVYGDLLKAGYKVIVMDLRGNGRSDYPHNDAGYANDAEAKDVIAIVSLLKVKQYYVVGYSRGSIIASRLLVLDKQRVKKAVLGGMGDGYTDANWPRRVHAYKALMGDTTFHDVDGLMTYVHSNHFDNLALAYQQKWQPSTSKQELAKVKIPVLIIRGTEDKENGSETVLQSFIPNSKLSYVPGDHGSANRSQQFADAVTGFFIDKN